ncbi:IPTL-CTERM sorting domain-containing protein, partial [Paracidovorax cattleyae]
ATATTCTVTGLTNGTAYTFMVVAGNGAGPSAPSAASNAVTPKGTQTILFAPPGPQDFGTSPTLAATADSGLAPTFTSGSPSVCAITEAGALTFLTAGSCTVHADQAGSPAYLAAAQVSRTFAVVARLSVAGAVPGMAGLATATLSGGGAGCTLAATGTAFVTPGGLPAGYTLPHGGFAFVATGCAGSVTLALVYPQALPAGVQFWKFGPAAPGDTTSTWFQWTGAILSPDHRTVTYTVVDNGIGDADTAVGTIRDPFAPITAVAAGNVSPIPTLSQWGLVLMSLLAAALGMTSRHLRAP